MTNSDREEPKFTVVRPDQLSAESLRGLSEEFVTRDGTDYGAVEKTLEDKVSRVERLLAAGEVSIVFEHETERVHIVPTQDLGPD